MKKVLILYTSIGQGHKFIAENYAFHLQQVGFEVYSRDILALEQKKIGNFGTKLYQTIISSFPWIWDFLYDSTLIYKLTSGLRLFVAGNNTDKVLPLLKELQPDVVITTQTTATAVMSYLKTKGLYTGKLVTSFSDFHFHPFWVYPLVDAYLINIEEQKQELTKLGVRNEQIFLCGMTLKPLIHINKSEIQLKLHLDTSKKTLLVGTGSQGIGLSAKNITELIEKAPDYNYIIACGMNNELQSQLTKVLKDKHNVKILGFYTPMQELYAVADIFLTKPGGLSFSESLQTGIPGFITHVMPGQEKHNTAYLLKNRLTIHFKTFEPEKVLEAIQNELATGALKNQISQEKAKKLIQDDPVHSGVVQAIQSLFHD